MHKASVEERLKLKRIQIDTWSTREHLCLASSVLRSGDQNWVSVSRSVRALGDPGRPVDWFSQKNCALQYERLLENVETPKRKRGDKGEETNPPTPGECIVQKLTMERVDELKKLMVKEQEKYKRLKTDVIELTSGRADNRLDEINQQIEEEKRQKELEQIAHEKRMKEREEKILEIQRAFRPQAYGIQRKTLTPVRPSGPLELNVGSDTELSQDSLLSEGLNVDIVTEETTQTPVKGLEEKSAPTPTSPLLTSLLKSPSPAPTSQASILHNAITAQRAAAAAVAASTASSTPTISSLLAASPTKRESGTPGTFSPGLSHLVTSAISSGVTETPEDNSRPQTVANTSPSAGAPTLSMLLELPPSIPGTPLPELPPSTSQTGEEMSGQQVIAQLMTSGLEEQQLISRPDVTVEGQLTMTQAVTSGSFVSTSNALAGRDMATGGMMSTVGQGMTAVNQVQMMPITRLPPVLDTSIDDNQVDKIVTEMKMIFQAEERTADHVESVLGELPQEVVALIEEVEMAEEAQKQRQQQQPSSQVKEQPVSKPQQEEAQLKIQEIQQQLVASAPQTPAMVAEVIKEPVKEIEVIPEVPAVVEVPLKVRPQEEIKEEVVPIPKEECKAVEVKEKEVIIKEEAVEQATKTEEVVEFPSKPAKKIVEIVDYPSKPAKKVVEVEPEPEVTPEKQVIEKEAEVEPEPSVEPVNDTMIEAPLSETPAIIVESPESEDTTEDTEDEVKPEPEVEEEVIGLGSPLPHPAEDDTLSTPVTTRRRHAPPLSTPSTPIDSVPNSPASVGISASDEDRDYRTWKKSILLIWSRLAAHKNASIFTRPITNDQAPGYYNIVFRPMDLTTIKRNLENGQIRTTIEFQRDLMLMFSNAIMYNASDHEVPKLAHEMQTDCLNSIQMFLSSLHEAPSSAARRETRETNKRHEAYIPGDGEDSETSRSAAPSPLPLKRKRTTTVSTVEERSGKKRRSSIVP